MKSYVVGVGVALLILVAMVVVSFHQAEARGRYSSTRIGGYTSSGKGSHYVGGYVRSCHGYVCK